MKGDSNVMERIKSACFSGHRPQKLTRVDWVTWQLSEAIDRAIRSGITQFFCGMAQGVDLIAGELVLSVKEEHPEIQLVAVVPFPRQAYYWEDEWIARYNRVLYAADRQICLEADYSDGIFFRRNRYLVEQSDLLIAVCRKEETRSGTAQTIRFAKKKGIPVDWIPL